MESWGTFAVVIAFLAGMIGGCTSSSSASISVFRWQIVFAAIRAQIMRLHSPYRVVTVKYDDRTVTADVLDPLILYVTGYILTLGVLTMLLDLTGVDMMSAVFAVWTSLGNIGFGFGPIVALTGTMIEFSDAGKWIMILAMLMGRLGLLAVLVLVLPRFWRWGT